MNERIGTAETARILNCSLTHARKLMKIANADTRRESRAQWFLNESGQLSLV